MASFTLCFTSSLSPKVQWDLQDFRHWAGNLFDPDLSQCAWKSTLGGTSVPSLATSRKLSKYIEQKPLGLYTDWPTNQQVQKNIPSFFNGEGGGLKIYILIVIDGWILNSNPIFLSIPSTLCVIGKRSLELFTNQKQFSSLDMTKLLTSTRWIPGSVNENSLYIRYQGIDPWWAKIRVIKEAFSPTDVPSRGLLSKQKTTFPSPRGEKQTPCESLKLLIYHLPTINQLYFLKTEFQFHVLHNINEIFFLLCHHLKKYWSIISITPWKRSYSLPQSKPLKVK